MFQIFLYLNKLNNFLAPIEGGFNVLARETMIRHMQQPEVGGYFLDGFHTNGITATTLQFEAIKPIVQRCTELLPSDKLKIMMGAYSPVTTLQLIQLGIDLFDNSYAYLATSHNCALTFGYSDSISTYDMDVADEK